MSVFESGRRSAADGHCWTLEVVKSLLVVVSWLRSFSFGVSSRGSMVQIAFRHDSSTSA
ncbi:hypothetical protein [Sphaerisporangium dianthi]|uniref:Uncharacterized protein n=1 Tax=Sphaerisporangium dianthi TaxID=1436120 RepID=A0ABV9C9B3_9ACTN